MDNDFDWACRRLARLAPVGVLIWLLTAFTQHLRFVNWLDTRSASLPGVPQGIRDTIAELHDLDMKRAWSFLLEFQLEPDPNMFGRLLVYLGTTWLELRPDELPGSRYYLAAAVVNLTGTRQSMPASWDMTLPGPDGVGCSLKVRERYLQEEAAMPLLQAIQAGLQGRILLPWIVLMKSDNIDDTIRLWLELWASEPDQRMRSEYVTLTGVFVELSAQRERWRQALKGLDMRKSAFLEEIRAEARREEREAMKKSAFLEEIRDEIRKEERAAQAARLDEALKEERAAQAATIVQVLHVKFPNQLPAELETTIKETRDPARLAQWFTAAATSTSLEEFRQACGV
jgi:hypothetical protein